MLEKVYIPYKGYWSSPFCRWQGKLAGEDAVHCGAATAKKFFELRGYTADMFDSLVLGTTVPQKQWFFAPPYFATMMGNPRISGPLIAQACATSAVSLNYGANTVEAGTHAKVLVATTDRCSNSPSLLWNNPRGMGGQPVYESWMVDGFNTDPVAQVSAAQTAENVGQEHGVTKEESDAMAVSRYQKYTDSLKNDREFQKRYMIGVDVKISRKETIVVDEDEGVIPCTEEGMAKLKPVIPGGILSFGAQTHAADGNAGMIVTTKEGADEMSADKNVTIQVLSYGYARAKQAFMAAAVTPCAEMALKNANITVADLGAVKTHNPFTVNDVVMGKLMGIDEKIFNNYGSSLIFGHPQGPTGMRQIIEMIEELVMKGGGYGLFAGCAAGDTAAGLVIKVN
ncbi:MAG TPA: thiolase family protein [Syntrophales bacterium]|nr:thiolase family protein [Syntrophales bacterium]HPQ45651.1 thiolase family protein [Syntrophales bacterium]